MKTLEGIAARLHGADRWDLPELEVSGLTDDSRRVQPGALFVAIKGGQADGHGYLEEAVERGAVAAVGEREVDLPIPYLRVPDSREALAQLAAAWHDHPAHELTMIGVTGTDGKTTTINLLHRILGEAGIRGGMITSVNAVIGDEILDTGFHVTTPPALEVQAYLRRMADAGLSHCLIEATSHGLAQRRILAREFDIAVVTNVTHEHLDYHGSLEAYRQAKAELFRGLGQGEVKAGGPERRAILNRDDSSYDYLQAATSVPVITYGGSEGSDVRGEALTAGPGGIEFQISGQGYTARITSPLLGTYNFWNCLAAFATAVEALGIPRDSAVAGIRSLESVPGRMERIDVGQDFLALVDFAHTPNALREALQAARTMAEGRVIAVFGSAGLRDREKRRMMARSSAELAEVTVLTAEDPRTESLEAILRAMAEAAQEAGAVEGETLLTEPDRGQALRRAVALAERGDVVIACGKGHEQSMCFGEVEYPWDDRRALKAALAEHLGLPGPEMPRLPTSEPTGAG